MPEEKPAPNPSAQRVLAPPPSAQFTDEEMTELQRLLVKVFSHGGGGDKAKINFHTTVTDAEGNQETYEVCADLTLTPITAAAVVELVE